MLEAIKEMSRDFCGRHCADGTCAGDLQPCDYTCTFAGESKKLYAKNYRKLGDKVIEFPVAVGDTVKCACEEQDEYGNPVVTLVPYEVYGLAVFKGKQYVLDGWGEMYEIGSRYCIVPENDGARSVENECS